MSTSPVLLSFLFFSWAAARRVSVSTSGASSDCTVMPAARPPVALRSFSSPAVEALILNYTSRLRDPRLAQLFANTFPNTLDTTVFAHNETDAFVITGDIPAMWLRDSTNQVLPYLPLAKGDAALTSLFRGLIARQAACVLLDPYANAFQFDARAPGAHAADATTRAAWAGFGPASNTVSANAMTNDIFERKYEADSLANVLRLGGAYFAATGDLAAFTGAHDWAAAAALAVATLDAQRAGTLEEDAAGGPPYVFQRTTGEPSDTLEHGRGAMALRTGLVKSAFRGSDDATVLPFSIPENVFAAAALRLAAAPLDALGAAQTAAAARALAAEIDAAVAAHGTFVHPRTGARVYAYEVDGFGNYWFQDDANIPSLLALPVYSDVVARNDTLYTATRDAVLSGANPYYFCGAAACGVGGQHNGAPFVWPMALCAQALASDNETEVGQLLQVLVDSSACTGLIHESFDSGNFNVYTRPWFAWVNGLFATVVLDVAQRFPSLVF